MKCDHLVDCCMKKNLWVRVAGAGNMQTKGFTNPVCKRLAVVCLSWLVTGQTIGQQVQPALYINPFIGASTSAGKAGIYHGLGKTFPGATTPYGAVQVSPNTITGGDNGSGYSYEHNSIEGFAFTQMSGIGWYGDLGNFLVMPTTGALHTSSGQLR